MVAKKINLLIGGLISLGCQFGLGAALSSKVLKATSVAGVATGVGAVQWRMHKTCDLSNCPVLPEAEAAECRAILAKHGFGAEAQKIEFRESNKWASASLGSKKVIGVPKEPTAFGQWSLLREFQRVLGHESEIVMATGAGIGSVVAPVLAKYLKTTAVKQLNGSHGTGRLCVRLLVATGLTLHTDTALRLVEYPLARRADQFATSQILQHPSVNYQAGLVDQASYYRQRQDDFENGVVNVATKYLIDAIDNHAFLTKREKEQEKARILQEFKDELHPSALCVLWNSILFTKDHLAGPNYQSVPMPQERAEMLESAAKQMQEKLS